MVPVVKWTLPAAFLCCLLGGTAGAQDAWPTKLINLVVPASAGSGTDIMARALAQPLSAALKQTILVENKPGASGMIGTNQVVKSAPDGNTLLYTNGSFAVIAPAISKTIPYDIARDLEPIAQTAVGGVLLLVNKDVPAKNLRELIDLVKANPDKYGTYGSWGNGTSGNLIMEWLKMKTGMQIQHVPYRTVPQLLTDLASGVLQIAWADPSAPLPLLQSGAIRGIAISGDVRVPQSKDIASMGEQGYAFEAKGWFGMFAPAGTPEAIVQRLTTEVNKIQASPEMAKRMEVLNFEPPPVKSQAEFKAIVSNDLKVWKQIATDAKIKIED